MWSHGLYGNENLIKKTVRLSFLKLANVIFLYEKRAKNLLIQSGFRENSLKVVYNSLDFNEHQELYIKLKGSSKYKWRGIFYYMNYMNLSTDYYPIKIKSKSDKIMEISFNRYNLTTKDLLIDKIL